jgi:small multidrug resistance pump
VSKYFVLLYVAATSLALIALKLGTKSGIPIHYVNSKLQFNVNFYTIAGVALYGLSFLTYIYLISKYDLGYIIPLTTALVYVIIFTASYFIFDEVFTSVKILGIILILSGLVLLNARS